MVSMLRQKLLDEVLERDNDDANRRVVQLQMQKVASGDRRAEPLVKSNMNSEQMQKLSVFVSSLQKSLEQKVRSGKLLTQSWANGKEQEKNIMDVCNVTQICVMYNYIVGVYQGVGTSQYTRLAMKSVLVSVQKNAELILMYMERFLAQVLNSHFISSYLYAMSVYRLMIGHIKRDSFNPITKKELMLEKKVLYNDVSQRSGMAPGIAYGDMGTH